MANVKINSIIDESPAVKIIEARQKGLEIMKEHKGNYKKISELIEPLAKEEKRLFAVAKKQNGSKLWDEKGVIERERHELIKELYRIEHKKF